MQKKRYSPFVFSNLRFAQKTGGGFESFRKFVNTEESSPLSKKSILGTYPRRSRSDQCPKGVQGWKKTEHPKSLFNRQTKTIVHFVYYTHSRVSVRMYLLDKEMTKFMSFFAQIGKNRKSFLFNSNPLQNK